AAFSSSDLLSAGDGGGQLAHAAELGVAALQQFGDGLHGKVVEGTHENGLEKLGGGLVIGVGAALGLGDDFGHDAEFGEVFRRAAQGFRGEVGFGGVAPQNRSATLGRNHRIDGVFE